MLSRRPSSKDEFLAAGPERAPLCQVVLLSYQPSSEFLATGPQRTPLRQMIPLSHPLSSKDGLLSASLRRPPLRQIILLSNWPGSKCPVCFATSVKLNCYPTSRAPSVSFALPPLRQIILQSRRPSHKCPVYFAAASSTTTILPAELQVSHLLRRLCYESIPSILMKFLSFLIKFF